MKNRKKVQLISKITKRAGCSVSSSMNLVFRMSQIVGIAPVRLDGCRVRESPSLCFVHGAIRTIINILGMYALIFDLTMDFEHSIRIQKYAHRVLWTMDFSAVMLIASVATYGSPTRIMEVLNCLHRIQKIKKTLTGNQLQSVWSERKKCLAFVCFLIFSIITVLVDYWTIVKDVLRDNKDTFIVSLYFGYELSYILVFMIEMQFLLIALEIYEALKGMNDALERASRLSMMQSFVINHTTKTVDETIRHLASTYHNLSLMIKRLEKAFSGILILLLLSCLLHMVITPNYSVVSIMSVKVDGFKLGVELCWCILHFLRAVIIIEPSHNTQVEMDRTHLLVSQLILQSTDGQVSEELDKFYRYIVLNKVAYTPMGVCTLNRPLLASIMSSVVTYLIILIQFQILGIH